jgi:anti-sigma factor RsiW
MHCQEVAERTTDYLEGALAPGERRRFERHLAECVACRQGLHQLHAVVELAAHLPAPQLSPALREQLLAAFRDQMASGA